MPIFRMAQTLIRYLPDILSFPLEAPGTYPITCVMVHHPIFSADDSVSLASWLLEEISRGHMPVWPSTPRYAARIVEGMAFLHGTRREEVMAALSTVPWSAVLDWDRLLAPVRALDAGSAGIAQLSASSSPAFSTFALASLSS